MTKETKKLIGKEILLFILASTAGMLASCSEAAFRAMVVAGLIYIYREVIVDD